MKFVKNARWMISNNLENKCDLCDIGKWALDKNNVLIVPFGKYSFTTGLIEEYECIGQIGKYQFLTGQKRESSCIECSKEKLDYLVEQLPINQVYYAIVVKVKNQTLFVMIVKWLISTTLEIFV